MARTIRRTKSKKHHSRFLSTYTLERDPNWPNMRGPGIFRWGRMHHGHPLILKQNHKDIQRRYHSDSGLNEFVFEDNYEFALLIGEKEYRAAWKRELTRWIKDPDYEIQNVKRKTFWDYC